MLVAKHFRELLSQTASGQAYRNNEIIVNMLW